MWRTGLASARSVFQQSSRCPSFIIYSPCQSSNLHRLTNGCRGLSAVSSFHHQNLLNRFDSRVTYLPPVRYCHKQTKEAEEHIYSRLYVPVDDPVKGKLIYTGNLAANMRALKIFSFGTSLVTICFQPFIISMDESVALKATMIGILGFFMAMNPILIHLLVKRYTIYMYFNKDMKTFTATTMTFFLGRKDLVFKAEDVTQNTSASMFTFLFVRGKPLFLDPTQFKDTAVYVHLMGYDKPLDLSPLKDTDSIMVVNSEKLRQKYPAIEVPEDFNRDNKIDTNKSETINVTPKSEIRDSEMTSDPEADTKVKEQSRY